MLIAIFWAIHILSSVYRISNKTDQSIHTIFLRRQNSINVIKFGGPASPPTRQQLRDTKYRQWIAISAETAQSSVKHKSHFSSEHIGTKCIDNTRWPQCSTCCARLYVWNHLSKRVRLESSSSNHAMADAANCANHFPPGTYNMGHIAKKPHKYQHLSVRSIQVISIKTSFQDEKFQALTPLH